MEAKIIFNNGEELTVQQNGSCFIVPSKPVFPEDLTNVQIVSEDSTTIVENGEIVECASIDENYWFAINEVPHAAIKEQDWEERLTSIEDALCEIASI